jgi:hypothetical protein
MFASISSSRPHQEIDAFAGGSKPHTMLSIMENELLGFFNTKTILPLRATCKEAKQSVDNHKHVYSNRIINFTLPYRKIHTLDMSYCDMITDADFQYLNGIHTLDIEGCKQITGAGFKHLHGLKKLNIKYCTGITDDAFVHLQGIQILEMSGCSNITDNAIVHLKGIQMLDMFECSNITDNALVHLKGIHTLNIAGCPKITNEAIGEHLQGIKYIYIADVGWYERNDEHYYDNFNFHDLPIGGIYSIADYNKEVLESMLSDKTRVLQCDSPQYFN